MGDITISGRVLTTLAAIGSATFIAVGVSAALHARVQEDAPAAERTALPVASRVFEVEAGYPQAQRFLGLVQAATRSQIGFEVPGAIAEILVREGQEVAAGDPVARLDTRALQARRHAAESTVRQIAAELELARARTERQAPLQKSGAISAQTFDDTRLAEKALAARLEAASAQLETLDIDLEKSTLRAPFAARVGLQILDTGAVTQPGSPVFTLVATAEREAHIGIAVEQAQRLETGRSYEIEWRGQAQQARLRAVRPDVNPTSMTVVAIFDLPADADAFDGEPVAVNLPRQVDAAGGWLPLSALLEGERGVWTVLALRDEQDGVHARREVVEVLHVSGDRAYVRGSLNHGDRVVADGVHRVAPGNIVSVIDDDAATPALRVAEA